MVTPVLVALDFSDLDRASALARRVAGHVEGFKVGLQLLMSQGPRAVTTIARLGLPVFADAKLHDIPNTVRGAARGLARSGARWVTVHASGGQAMMEAAVAGMSGATDEGSGVLAVTVLTSLDSDDLFTVGVDRGIVDQVAGLTDLAAKSGAEGVVCSPHEAGIVKGRAPGLLAVTAGIRAGGDDANDQKRIMTPAEAVAAGADLLVIGRSITEAPDPVAVVSAIAESLGR